MLKNIKLGILASGSGSNLQAIIDNIEKGYLSAEISIVIINNPNVKALERAKNHNLKSIVINHRDYNSREEFDDNILEVLKGHNIDLVVLAGFMRIISSNIIKEYPNKIMNIHPALLPSFPGIHACQKAIDAGVKISGCTVHFVDDGMDTGPIIMQSAVPVVVFDTADILAVRILEQEHIIYSRSIQLFAENRLVVNGKKVFIKPQHYQF